jgi:Cdc6-like AAA superfamily ATPase
MILGRECEFEKIKSLFDDHLKSLARPLSIYICGSPGTGKTFTVTNTIQALEKEVIISFYLKKQNNESKFSTNSQRFTSRVFH